MGPYIAWRQLGEEQSVRQQGFSLVEIAIALVIIAVLSSIALPRYLCLRDRVLESEVKLSLHNIRTLQAAFYSTHASYAKDFKDLGFDLVGAVSRPPVEKRKVTRWWDYRLRPTKIVDRIRAVDLPSGSDEWYRLQQVTEWEVTAKYLSFDQLEGEQQKSAQQSGLLGCVHIWWTIDQSGVLYTGQGVSRE